MARMRITRNKEGNIVGHIWKQDKKYYFYDNTTGRTKLFKSQYTRRKFIEGISPFYAKKKLRSVV